MKYLQQVTETWSSALTEKKFRNQLALSLLVFALFMVNHLYFLKVWQSRPGIQVNDLILNLLPPTDFSLPIFIIEYSATLIVIFFTLLRPHLFVKGVQMFIVVFLARTLSIYFLPLEPPRDMILLNDPIANFFFRTETVYVTKDLFFSGHVSAMFLFYLISYNRYVRAYLFAATIVVGIMIMWQHVHYSMDVIFAPLASYIAYRGVLWVHVQSKFGLALQDA